MAQKVALGLVGEALARKRLIENGFEIVEVGNRYSAYDLLAKKNGETFAINVKTGKNFLIKPQNIARLIYLYSKYGYVPTFLFQDGDQYICFSLTASFERLWHPRINEVGSASKEFRGVSLREAFLDEIRQFIQSYPELGFTSVADFITEATRLRLEELQKQYALIIESKEA